MKISQILKDAEKGNLEFCSKCLWSPKQNPSISFGISCTEHGVDWANDNKANSMLIVQDPGDTTPQDTGRLCAVHNAANPSDKTAQQSNKLWSATVSLEYKSPEKNGYMREHYWTNAVMHGASKKTSLRTTSLPPKQVQKCCSNILASQIISLQPKVIIACGTVAVNSLHEIGILKNRWDIVRHSFNKGAYKQVITKWRDAPEFIVFCTYHTSSGVVNRTVSRNYNFIETEKCIKEKLEKLNSPKSVEEFLSEYSDTQNAASKGMRYLLNHWLDIGVGT